MVENRVDKQRDIVFGVKNMIKFRNNREILFNTHRFGYLRIKNVYRCFSFQDKFVRDMFGKKAFADQESQCSVAAEVVKGCQGKVAVSTIIK